MSNEEDWWKSFHVVEMADLFLTRSDPDELTASVQFLAEELELDNGAWVYDQCCGTGTVSLELAKKGMNAVGADLCEIYIQRAQEESANQGLNCQFHCEDAFKFLPSHSVQGVFNWYSSYGYAGSDSRNQEMLCRAFECLKGNGKFALDVPNFPGVVKNFQYHLVRSGVSEGREVTCVRESQLDWKAGRLRQTWNWFVEGRKVDKRYSALRLYWPHQIVEALTEVGFAEIQMYGGIDKRPLKLDSPRLILVARKPE